MLYELFIPLLLHLLRYTSFILNKRETGNIYFFSFYFSIIY